MPRALMAVAPRTTELVEYDEPPLGDRDVRIRSEFAAPKHGTESHAYLDDQRRLARRFHPEYRIFVPDEDSGVSPFPRRLGNMTVGTVTEAGAAVTKFKVGDRVYGHLPIRETHTVPEDGPFKSTAAGPREQELHPVPPELSPEQVVLLDPAHFALAAVRDANVRVGERVAVFGLGAIGLLILQMTIMSGAVTVYAIDPLPSRRALARRLGATACLDPGACDVGLEIKQATAGAGVDVAIEHYRERGFVKLEQVISGEALRYFREVIGYAVGHYFVDDDRAPADKRVYQRSFLQRSTWYRSTRRSSRSPMRSGSPTSRAG